MATGWYQDGSTWYYLNAQVMEIKRQVGSSNVATGNVYISGALAVNTTP